jgi:hypothetical protein
LIEIKEIKRGGRSVFEVLTALQSLCQMLQHSNEAEFPKLNPPPPPKKKGLHEGKKAGLERESICLRKNLNFCTIVFSVFAEMDDFL